MCHCHLTAVNVSLYKDTMFRCHSVTVQVEYAVAGCDEERLLFEPLRAMRIHHSFDAVI